MMNPHARYLAYVMRSLGNIVYNTKRMPDSAATKEQILDSIESMVRDYESQTGEKIT
jgi:hypothetical protein